MDIYSYIGNTNPRLCLGLIRSYGYTYDPESVNVPHAMRQLVSQEGEQAFYDMLEFHPDKDLFMEYADQKLNVSGGSKSHECDCPSCQQNKYLNASGQTAAIISNQTNLFTIFGAMLVAGAILITNK